MQFHLWGLNRLFIRLNHTHNVNSPQTVTNGQHTNTNNTMSSNISISIVVSYTRGLSERFKKTCNSLGIQVYFKCSNTIHTLLMAPKDKDNICQKSMVMYWFKYPHRDYSEEYIWESGRTFGDRLRSMLESYSSLQPDHRTSCEFEVFHHSGQAVTGCHYDHKGNSVHLCK